MTVGLRKALEGATAQFSYHLTVAPKIVSAHYRQEKRESIDHVIAFVSDCIIDVTAKLRSGTYLARQGAQNGRLHKRGGDV